MTDETPPVIAIVKKIIIIIPKSEFLLFLTGPSEGMQTRRLIKQSQQKNAFYHERASALVLHIHMV